ncbi:hypothetical protein HYH02_009392 [Chlamydomonas schloesseri]|uniref:Uncharacterized protein n=1 Tax=Chlamydomonas schloesseri TaxID=2026947 RepID=A0A835TFU3_9CHLO|nr:hypothetical protein HYH02_009392 [Chlamydomonas schloesseri]|eukprot:KAG2443326.1 hypothetical protein HYH02_009392 [Chlamydomonas schloesseri]
MASTSTAPAATILQGPLDFTQPKGLDKVALLVLCPPSDLLDMQRLTKLAAKLFTLLCKLLVALSFLVIPAWLWLVRHEYAIGHTGDAAVVGVGGVLLFLAADAVNKAAASSAAEAKAGVFTASERSAYQSSPGYVASVAAAAAPASAAVHAAAAPRAAAGAAAHRSVPAYAASSTDPAVRQVKQRIMKLERLLFGNELTEADIGPDMLQGRVQALCLEVGVPFGGHGRSSSHLSAGELDAQLQAVEKALGI